MHDLEKKHGYSRELAQETVNKTLDGIAKRSRDAVIQKVVDAVRRIMSN
jgi:hypothetical protein